MRKQLDNDMSPDDKLTQQLVEVGDRLCRQFAVTGGPSADSVREQVRRARVDFGSPKVVTYLPVLIERSVRRDLGTASEAPDHADRG